MRNGVTEMTAKYTLKPIGKRQYHRDSMMSKIEVMLVMIFPRFWLSLFYRNGE